MAIADQRIVIALGILGEICQQDVDDDDIIFHELNSCDISKHFLDGMNREGPREFSGMEGYVENVIPRYSDLYFKKHFRMSRGSFEVRTQN